MTHYNTRGMDANRGTPQGSGQTIQSRTPQGRGMDANRGTPQGSGRTVQSQTPQGRGMDANRGTPQDPGRTIQSQTPQGRGMDANRGTPQGPDHSFQSQTPQGRGMDANRGTLQDPGQTIQSQTPQGRGMDANRGTPQGPDHSFQSQTPQGRDMDANRGTPRRLEQQITSRTRGVDNRNSHLVGFYARSRQEQHSEPVTSAIEGKLDQMAAMMQSQQEALSKFAMDNQALRMTVEALKEEVGSMREEIANLQSAGQEDTTPDEALASSNDERLDTNLSGDVKKLYEEFDADFDLEERCWLLILEAVHRYYESLRRKLVTDMRPDRVAIKEANDRNTKVRSRQKALYDRRKKLCPTKEEKKRWREIIPAYMTEESDDGEGSYRTHSPSWQSTELEDFIQELDQRWTVKSVLKKPRVVSTPLVCEAPRGAPAWAVRARSISPTVTTAYHDAPQNGHQLQSSYTEVEQVEDPAVASGGTGHDQMHAAYDSESLTHYPLPQDDYSDGYSPSPYYARNIQPPQDQYYLQFSQRPVNNDHCINHYEESLSSQQGQYATPPNLVHQVDLADPVDAIFEDSD
ncbi:uncharacterized protein [Dysidea avara]|uniref:uncharacterized protein isoform X1 n=1 Tax=Dysidea avara TaxID=196820 RepID=UPI00332EADBC